MSLTVNNDSIGQTQLAFISGNEVKVFSVSSITQLVFELMKLNIFNQQVDKEGRAAERKWQLLFMERESDNYKSQAKWALISHIGSGILGIAAGVVPIAGYMKGGSILSGLSNVPFMSSLKGYDPKEFFKNLAQILSSCAETQKAMDGVHRAKAESERIRWSTQGNIASADQQVETEALNRGEQDFRSMTQLIETVFRYQHEGVAALAR